MSRILDAMPNADDVLRASVAKLPFPPFNTPAFTQPPPQAQMRVAIVTTAGLMRHGEEAWDHDDPGFRVFDVDESDLMAGHVSMNLDRTGMYLDRNVFYPIDRLRERVAAGTIGSVASRHISFMGASLRGNNQLSTMMLDSAPRAAKLLRDDGVDVVLLTPVCPACSRTTLILGHVLEAQGLATVVLASNLELAKRAKPPRALFCDFPLGRPVGNPKDADMQHRVLDAAFDLLSRRDGPVLEIFPEIVKSDAETAIVCTMPPRFDPNVPPPVDEAQGLRHAWERAKVANGGTHLGRLLSADQVPDAIAKFVAVAEGTPWRQPFTSETEMLQAAADIRIYYEEAASALIDYVPAARAAEAWFYRNTETGRVFKAVFRRLRESGEEKKLSLMALYYIVPLSQDDDFRGAAPWSSGKLGAGK